MLINTKHKRFECIHCAFRSIRCTACGKSCTRYYRELCSIVSADETLSFMDISGLMKGVKAPNLYSDYLCEYDFHKYCFENSDVQVVEIYQHQGYEVLLISLKEQICANCLSEVIKPRRDSSPLYCTKCIENIVTRMEEHLSDRANELKSSNLNKTKYKRVRELFIGIPHVHNITLGSKRREARFSFPIRGGGCYVSLTLQFHDELELDTMFKDVELFDYKRFIEIVLKLLNKKLLDLGKEAFPSHYKDSLQLDRQTNKLFVSIRKSQLKQLELSSEGVMASPMGRICDLCGAKPRGKIMGGAHLFYYEACVICILCAKNCYGVRSLGVTFRESSFSPIETREECALCGRSGTRMDIWVHEACKKQVKGEITSKQVQCENCNYRDQYPILSGYMPCTCRRGIYDCYITVECNCKKETPLPCNESDCKEKKEMPTDEVPVFGMEDNSLDDLVAFIDSDIT